MQKSKKPASKAGFSNLAPLTGIAFASNWLISKLNLNLFAVKTTRLTPNSCWLFKAGLNTSLHVLMVLRCSLQRKDS